MAEVRVRVPQPGTKYLIQVPEDMSSTRIVMMLESLNDWSRPENDALFSAVRGLDFKITEIKTPATIQMQTEETDGT